MRSLLLSTLFTMLCSSCSSLLWSSHSIVPLNEEISSNSEMVLLDFEGNVSPKGITAKNNDDSSGKLASLKVPKFASASASMVPIQYLCILSGLDTVVYQLTFKVRRPMPIAGITLGSWATVSTIDRFGNASYIYGALVSILGFAFVDLPTGLAAFVMHDLKSYPVKPAWKIKNVALIPEASVPPKIIKALRDRS